VIAGLAVSGLLFVADQLSVHYGLRGSQRVADDILGGLIAGLLVFWYEHARSRYVMERLKTIALMNHHVRNALQVIALSTHMPPDAEQIARMKDAVERIEWALREVLPGQVLDFDQHRKAPANAEPPGRFSASA
jgi:hypothetical protein